MVEENNKDYSAFLKAGWIIALILAALILGGVFLPKLIHAAPEWPLNKSQTCSMFNFTEDVCDSYWCKSFIGGNWTNDSICLVIINSTNITIIPAVNCSDTNISVAVYNSNCINKINSTNQTSLDSNNSIYVTKEDLKNTTMIIRDMIAYSKENQTYYNSNDYTTETVQPNWTIIAFIVLVVCVCICFLAWTGINKKTLVANQFKKKFDKKAFEEANNQEDKKQEEKKE
ncbi:MAG: hypothetical protein WC933_03830 [Candidatus Paceibacterota bacterium]|jgi:hypothetical protein